MTSMTDGVHLERLARYYKGELCGGWDKAAAAPTCVGCRNRVPSWSSDRPCDDCLRLVVDTLRDAAGKADK